ncbi:Collagen triple helix repeat-containing protein 1 [Holothuria leucospilota]|uniref:Collagen triple helix repeat-containing protein 1 n=1 Tax=Holothuria leucospilota TaxID=206669 RepID=A0A9Q1C0W1_HOLLE|nr:Collagen triple helix repeat-containing protein 1 [Holothuria leucospilota]
MEIFIWFLVIVLPVFIISSGKASQQCVGPRGHSGDQGDDGAVGSGVCDGLSAGSIDVTINAGPCSGYGTSDLKTGWNAVSRILIEEWPSSPY